ncbi:glutamyl-tRNA synthetase [Steroidobacter denitrificans]|uniref:Glutamate--tRNA ligase n=1 Tax=Steroidobacter denitrificans TaxID=465721 RepID=A0A127F7Q9_STEDE|nr:glutamate--tRNA ligase [Steroidobacter denitrificans]AMN46447.1 glutamyl-tRNA synthetase [Steroidobacter denitrificans]
MTIRTRFAPSPTGMLHIGGVRTALFSWLYARRAHGVFILRVEDTDRERSTEEATQVILDGMRWLGLDADEGPFYQSRRMDRYREVITQFLQAGHAYRCYCTKEELEAMRAEQLAAKQKPRYDGTCRHRNEPRAGVDPVIRFRNPSEGAVIVEDAIHGRVAFANSELDDLIIARSDGSPTYNFCVVVDDMDMRVTHVIRGDDHLNNTPRQINMLKALGAPPPMYAHVPMILGADGAKLSKRHGAVSVLQYREEGYLPEALLNYLVRLGWSHGDQEIFSMQEMIDLFDIEDVNKSASAFNPDKLLWLNQQHIMRSTPEHLAVHLKPQLAALGVTVSDDAKLAAVAGAQQERAKTLKEMAQNSVFFFREPQGYDEKAAKKNLTPDSGATLEALHAKLSGITEWTAAAAHEAVNEVASQLGVGMGKVAQPLRVAVSGTSVSPPIDVTLEVLGREAVLSRIERALEYVRAL